MTDTDNHQYNIPPQGSHGWATKLNENFTAFETDIPLLDSFQEIDGAIVQDPYTPHDGAWFVASDTAEVYTGDGQTWTHLGSIPKPQTATLSGDGSTTTFTVTHNTGVTPRQVVLTPKTEHAAGAHWVENETDTEFDVVFASAPASGTDNIEFDVAVVA